jgi:S-adenosylmethionine uptake transporter
MTTLGKFLGLLWKIESLTCFVAINVLVKYLTLSASSTTSEALPVHVLMFFQNLLAASCMKTLIVPQADAPVPTNHYALYFLKGLVSVVGTGMWYMTLKKMTLMRATALGFLNPICSLVGARIFLGERIGWKRLFFNLITLVGTSIMLRLDTLVTGQDTAFPDWTMLYPISAIVCFTASKIMMRYLILRGESASRLATFQILFSLPISFLLAVASPGEVWRVWNYWPWIVVMGLLTIGARYGDTKSCSLTEISFLTPLGVIKILLSVWLAWLVLGEYPSPHIWIGVGWMVGMTLGVIVYERTSGGM